MIQALAVVQGQGIEFDTRIGKIEGPGGAAVLRADRQPSLIDPDTQLKVEALGKLQGSDAARLGATLAKLTMRWELGG